MEEEAGTSQPAASQSILASRLSPDLLAPTSPENPEPEPDANANQLESETYTQAEFRPQPDEDSSISSDSRSSVSTALYDAEDSRSSFSHRRLRGDSGGAAGAGGAAQGEQPPAKLRKVSEGDDIDGETCPICLDTWGSSGTHRLVALRCGHLFGAHCVERWLRAQPVKDRACPTCKTRAATRDIRQIYARRLVAADTSQVAALQKQVDTLQAEKSRVELELQKSKIAHRACALQLEALRSSLNKSQPREPEAGKTWRFSLEKNLEVQKEGGCRVLAYNCRTYELYVSQKSASRLFPGYGVRRVSCVDYSLGQFAHLHTKPIRDMAYSQPRDLLLSAGLDGVARVVERGLAGAAVSAGAPLWSCCWDRLRPDELYLGAVGGAVLQYDVRNYSAPLRRLQAPADMSPVVSLCSTEHGLLSCQLNSCWLWTDKGEQWEPRSLPVEGPFMSLCYDAESSRALVSCRPKANGERSQLVVCRVMAGGAHAEATFPGSQRAAELSRATWVIAGGAGIGGARWAAAHSESAGALQLHGVGGARSLALPAAEAARDLSAPRLAPHTLLAALSDSRLRIYRASPAQS